MDTPEASKTVFRFTAEGVDVEFAGSESFVEKQIERYRAFLENAVGQTTGAPHPPASPARAEGGATSSPAAPATAPPSKEAPKRVPPVDEFAKAHPTREGRGAIQDRILLFTYYLTEVQGKHAVTKEDISWCFQKSGHGVPKNLLNALGNMKRKLGLLQTSGRRGLYQVSPKGRQYVEQHFSV